MSICLRPPWHRARRHRFLLIGLVGGLCGLLQIPWLTAAALISIAVLLVVFHYEERGRRTGITTEMAGIATFCLTYLTATPGLEFGPPLAIGTPKPSSTTRSASSRWSS